VEGYKYPSLKCIRCSRHGRIIRGKLGPDNLAHFWKNLAKYLACNLGDTHLAIFWPLADFRGGRIIHPIFEISGRNIRLPFWVTRLWSLADFGGGRNIRPDLKYPARFEISGQNIRLHFWVTCLWSLANFGGGRNIWPHFWVTRIMSSYGP
jgi:hypothetical protein